MIALSAGSVPFAALIPLRVRSRAAGLPPQRGRCSRGSPLQRTPPSPRSLGPTAASSATAPPANRRDSHGLDPDPRFRPEGPSAGREGPAAPRPGAAARRKRARPTWRTPACLIPRRARGAKPASRSRGSRTRARGRRAVPPLGGSSFSPDLCVSSGAFVKRTPPRAGGPRSFGVRSQRLSARGEVARVRACARPLPTACRPPRGRARTRLAPEGAERAPRESS